MCAGKPPIHDEVSRVCKFTIFWPLNYSVFRSRAGFFLRGFISRLYAFRLRLQCGRFTPAASWTVHWSPSLKPCRARGTHKNLLPHFGQITFIKLQCQKCWFLAVNPPRSWHCSCLFPSTCSVSKTTPLSEHINSVAAPSLQSEDALNGMKHLISHSVLGKFQ